MSESKYSPTREEQRWCRETIDRINDLIPKHYTGVALARLESLGISVTQREVIDCRNGRRHDIRIVSVLEQMARDLGKRPNLPTRDEIRQKYFKN